MPAETLDRSASPLLFALVGLAFLLPFATVSCDGARTTFTGAQLVAHTVPQGGKVAEPPDCSTEISRCVERSGSGVATAALLAAALGFVLGIVGARRGPGWCAAAGLAAVLLLGAKAVGPFGPDVTFHSGYWLTLLLFVSTTVLHGKRALARRRRRSGTRQLSGSP